MTRAPVLLRSPQPSFDDIIHHHTRTLSEKQDSKLRAIDNKANANPKHCWWIDDTWYTLSSQLLSKSSAATATATAAAVVLAATTTTNPSELQDALASSLSSALAISATPVQPSSLGITSALFPNQTWQGSEKAKIKGYSIGTVYAVHGARDVQVKPSSLIRVEMPAVFCARKAR